MSGVINTIAELQLYVTVNNNFDICSIETEFDPVFEKYLRQWLGRDQYDQLVSAYQSATLTPSEQLLLPHVQRIIAKLALWEHSPMAQVQVSDSGIHAAVTDKYKSASDGQYQRLIDALCDQGHDAIEVMLKFLEENETDYPLWAADEGYTRNKELVVNSAEEFSKHYRIKRGRQAYVCLRDSIMHVECFDLVECIGQEFYDELKQEILDKTVTTENEKALKLIRPAVVYAAIAEAAAKNVFQVDPEGNLYIEYKAASGSVKEKKRTSSDMLQLKIKQAYSNSQTYFRKLKTFLDANIDDYQTYKDSDAYEDPEDPDTCEHRNTHGKPSSGAVAL